MTAAPHSLADVMPSVAASFGVDIRNPLDLSPTRDAVLVLVDGLGAELIRAHADEAPTLAAMATRMISAGFPATTATSLTSLAVGEPCSEHGIIGYSFNIAREADGPPTTFNSLRWTIGDASGPSALDDYPPDVVQARPSLLETLGGHGVDINYVMRPEFENSGLTRAAFRADGRYLPAVSLDEVAAAVQTAVGKFSPVPRFVYAYYGDLDMIGHVHGPGSPEWLESLRAVDTFVANLATDLPRDCALLVTADHGMVSAERTIDLDAHPQLTSGVAAIAGEARVRHIYSAPGAHEGVLAAWREVLGSDARVLSREQALDEGLFGSGERSRHANRMGDVIAVAGEGAVLVRTENEPFESMMVGHHGANTALEQHIPLIVR